MLLTTYLRGIGSTILQSVLNHWIVLFLIGKNNTVSNSILISKRNEFYIQEYFYLIYAYKVPEFFLKDCSSNLDLNKTPGSHLISKKSYNPLYSTTITGNILPHIPPLAPVGSRPNPKVLDYITFKLECAFEGDLEALVSCLPCLWFYDVIETEVRNNIKNNSYLNNHNFSNFSDWINFFRYGQSSAYFTKACNIINTLFENYKNQNLSSPLQVVSKQNALETIFIQACILEYDFWDSL